MDNSIKDNLTERSEPSPLKRPPVDIKDEAAIIAEFRRLKKKINKLYNELQLSRHSVKVFKQLFFDAPEFEEVRNLVLSFADEYAVIKNEIEDAKRFKKFERDDAKKRTKEFIDKFAAVGGDIETARLIFSDCFDPQKHKLEEYTYGSVEEELITKLKLSPAGSRNIPACNEFLQKAAEQRKEKVRLLGSGFYDGDRCKDDE